MGCKIDKIVRDDDGSVVCVLNDRLLLKQGITPMGLMSLHLLYKERARYVKGMEEAGPENAEVLQWYTKKITEADRELQKIWNFPVDDNYHRWWEVPHCVCPSLDNSERYGTPYRIINGDCPVHGQMEKTYEEGDDV